MPTALICDDEPLMRANLRDHLRTLWPELQVVGEAVDGPEALRQIEALRPSIAFLDIQMPGLTGLQVAQLVDARTQVVFVTAFDRYALDAFDAQAVDYLLKPLDVARLARLVARLKRADEAATPSAGTDLHAQLQALARQLAARADPPHEAALTWLQVDMGRQIQMLHVDDVMFFEADSKLTRVVAADCDGHIRLSLKELLTSLDPQLYLQIHRSMVVNRRFVRAVHRNGTGMELELRGHAERLKVSESNQPLFKAM